MNPIRCPWCDRPFEPREKGGTPQRFCSAPCRSEYHTACRQLGDQLVSLGIVAMPELKSTDARLLAKLVKADILPAGKRARFSEAEEPLTPPQSAAG